MTGSYGFPTKYEEKNVDHLFRPKTSSDPVTTVYVLFVPHSKLYTFYLCHTATTVAGFSLIFYRGSAPGPHSIGSKTPTKWTCLDVHNVFDN